MTEAKSEVVFIETKTDSDKSKELKLSPLEQHFLTHATTSKFMTEFTVGKSAMSSLGQADDKSLVLYGNPTVMMWHSDLIASILNTTPPYVIASDISVNPKMLTLYWLRINNIKYSPTYPEMTLQEFFDLLDIRNYFNDKTDDSPIYWIPLAFLKVEYKQLALENKQKLVKLVDTSRQEVGKNSYLREVIINNIVKFLPEIEDEFSHVLVEFTHKGIDHKQMCAKREVLIDNEALGKFLKDKGYNMNDPNWCIYDVTANYLIIRSKNSILVEYRFSK